MKYLGFYDNTDTEGRQAPLAAVTKMSYIAESIVKAGIDVEIVSASMSSPKGYFKGGATEIAEGITLKKFSAYKRKNIFQKVITHIRFYLVLFFYLVFCVKKEENVIVYHSLALMRIVRLAQFFKRFRLIFEIEEIYGDVKGCEKTVKRELKYFQCADAYIFPTELLNEKVNKAQKPYAVVHGTYHVEKTIGEKFNDGRIHCVYAGTFDPRKGGVATAVAVAEFLNENYHVHILGFGSKEDEKLLINTIQKVSQKTKCKITYDGLLSGGDYIKFIQSCDIGLSTQNPSADFNDTSFPSKVLSYMANGLRVVSVKIKALENSGVNELLYYYEGNDPKKIAETIMSIDINDGYDSRKRIQELDKEFGEDLKLLLGEDK